MQEYVEHHFTFPCGCHTLLKDVFCGNARETLAELPSPKHSTRGKTEKKDSDDDGQCVQPRAANLVTLPTARLEPCRSENVLAMKENMAPYKFPLAGTRTGNCTMLFETINCHYLLCFRSTLSLMRRMKLPIFEAELRFLLGSGMGASPEGAGAVVPWAGVAAREVSAGGAGLID